MFQQKENPQIPTCLLSLLRIFKLFPEKLNPMFLYFLQINSYLKIIISEFEKYYITKEKWEEKAKNLDIVADQF